MKKNIVNIDDLEWEKSEEHGDFSYYEKAFTPIVCGEKLGATVYQLLPGKKTFPYHFHNGNEEAIFILEGSGTLRLDDEMIPVDAGDYIAFPVGPLHAHQMINTSDQPLIYLCFSTMQYPEVVEYPDSKKVSVSVITAPDASNHEKKFLRRRFRIRDQVDYFEGEN